MIHMIQEPCYSVPKKLCAFFAPDDIPHALLRDNASTLPAPLDDIMTNDLKWDDILLALRRYALVEVGEQTLAVHRLVQAVTRDRLPVDERSQWTEVAVAQIAKVFSDAGAPFEPWTWPTYSQYLPHAMAAVSHADKASNASVGTAFLFSGIGAYLRERAQFEESKPYLERSLAICEQVLGLDHPDTAISLNNLGYLLEAQGGLAGTQPYYERALAIRERVLGSDHPDTANSLNNLGYLQYSQGNLSRAKAYYERALTICCLRLGQGHYLTQIVQANLEALEAAE